MYHVVHAARIESASTCSVVESSTPFFIRLVRSYASDVAHVRFNLKVVQIHAPEDDPVLADAGTNLRWDFTAVWQPDSLG